VLKIHLRITKEALHCLGPRIAQSAETVITSFIVLTKSVMSVTVPWHTQNIRLLLHARERRQDRAS